ncbi:hypothetical protein CCACVL1_05960 [Corchorus capsularis]|uniref:Uncharacterized protein n=1 Tax=Corchorus capsularis TaxID=210143 RepID=A0A1R3JI30_COCAP|nr:hypothetical protein CCACVL1_05960 [Corchorus capsularis]
MGLIESQDMLGFLDGSITMPSRILPPDGDTTNGINPPKENPKFAEWRKSNRLLLGWITRTLSEETLGLVVELDTAAEVWKVAHSYDGSTQEHEFALEQKLHKHHRDRFSSMNEYIQVFKETCNEFAAIEKPLQDKDKVFTLPTGLGKDYEAFLTTMLKPPRPTFYELMSHLKSHEIIRSMNTDLVLSQSNNQVFLAQRHDRGGFRGRGSSRGGKHNASLTSKGQGFSHSGSVLPQQTVTLSQNTALQQSDVPPPLQQLSQIDPLPYIATLPQLQITAPLPQQSQITTPLSQINALLDAATLPQNTTQRTSIP